MGFLSHEIKRSQLEDGDHIYAYRAAYTFSHHGIYIGQNKVIHFTNFDQTEIFSSSPMSPILCDVPKCGFRQPNSGVVLSCLDCFLGKSSLHRFQYNVSTSFFLIKVRGGTCTTAESDPPSSVIRRAMTLLQNGFGKFDVLKNNCEDFAFYCKTSLLVSRSGQASSIISVPVSLIVSSVFIWTPIGMATVAAGMYCLSRYGDDIGVRNNLVKVRVEDIGLFHK